MMVPVILLSWKLFFHLQYLLLVLEVARSTFFGEGTFSGRSNSMMPSFEIIRVEGNRSVCKTVTILDVGIIKTEAVQNVNVNNESLACFSHTWSRYPDDGESFICSTKNKNKLIEIDRDMKIIAYYNQREPSVHIHVALVIGELSENSRHEGDKKLRDIFGHLSMQLDLSIWSDVYTSPCPTVLPFMNKGYKPEKVIGTTMSHTRVLRDFVFQFKRSLERHILIILEGDAICGVPDCGRRAIKEAMASKVDYLNLGWCYMEDGDNTGRTALCTHAEAYSLHGASILAERMNDCGYQPVDVQIRDLKQQGIISFALAALSEDEEKSQKDWSTNGLFIQQGK